MRVIPISLALLTACGTPSSPTPSTRPEPDRAPLDEEPPADSPATTDATPCDPSGAQITISPGETRTLDTGLTVTFAGLQHDHYDDGSFDILATLTFARGDETAPRLVSILAPHGPERLLDHCVRITGAGGDTLAVEVGLLRAPEP